MEIFKDVEGYEGLYQISNIGRVKSLVRKWVVKDKIIKPYKLSTGYLGLRLSVDGNVKNFLHHRLVAEMFIPNPEKLGYVNHKNGVKHDNRIDNLEWCTSSENLKHALITGLKTPLKGSQVGTSKLKEFEVIIIKELLDSEVNYNQIAFRFNVSKQTVLDIKSKKTWKHL